MRVRAELVVFAVFGAVDAYADGEGPPYAALNRPIGVGEIADDRYAFDWIDLDGRVHTGTVTLSFHYTAIIPPTAAAGALDPARIDGNLIVEGIPERDQTNAAVWDTSGVPSGNYWIWSVAQEVPPESGVNVMFSPGVVTVRHAGEDVGPAVVISEPDSLTDVADARFRIEYAALDPDGTASVKLEAADSSSVFTTIADDLPAVADGAFDWYTASIPPGDWSLRATITDGRRRSFVAYTRYYLLILHPGSMRDAGSMRANNEAEGCGCRSSSPRAAWLVSVLPLLVLRRRSVGPLTSGCGKTSGGAGCDSRPLASRARR